MKNITYLISYAWKKSKLLFLTTSLKYVFSGVIPLVGIVGIGMVVESLEKNDSLEKTLLKIAVFLSVNLGISLIRILLAFADSIVMRKASDVTQRDYMQDCIFINYHYVEDGSVLNLKKKSMGANPVWFLDSICNILLYVVQFVGIAYLFFILSPWFIVLIVITSTVTVLIDFAKKKNDYTYETAQTENNRKLEYLYDTMSNHKFAKEIRVNEAGKFLIEKYDLLIKNFNSQAKRMARLKLGLDTVVSIVAVTQTTMMYIFFSLQVARGHITIAEYTVLLGATTLLISIISGFFGCLGNIRKTLAYTDLFRGYQESIRNNSNIDRYGCTASPDIRWEKAKVRFSHVSFSYPNREDVVLDDIDFVIEPGERVAIVGLNGAGKTTIVKLLLRLYDPTKGNIFINDVDIRDIPHKEYVGHIGTVLQDFCVFAYSIKENIVFDGIFDESRCSNAMGRSGFSEVVNKFAKGIDTQLYKYIDDDGIELSGGEGQRLTIARAIYKKADIIIMDEPTSMLDPLAESSLFEKMLDVSVRKSTIIISHRLSSAVFCDRILVISKGRLIESGHHDKLIELNGVYAKMFRSQAKYYEGGRDENE